MGLTELIAKHVPGCSTLPQKQQLCKQIADYCSQSAKALEAQIEQLEEEFNRNVKIAETQGEAVTPEYISVVCGGIGLALFKLGKLHDESDAFLYGLRARLPLLLFFTKKSKLERELGYSPSYLPNQTNS